ncbi:hypothetical protein NJ7G_2370 [Natrinema sp. J7-2]|nr:hypothetical protein NJ7G_2370 [Natrinema sp. J7-2]
MLTTETVGHSVNATSLDATHSWPFDRQPMTGRRRDHGPRGVVSRAALETQATNRNRG